jgi:photosystem II stability/assembly factor-like uncharacterized protein
MSPLLFAALAALGQPQPADAPPGGDIAWRNVGPGGGGWIQSLACDPVRENVLHVGCDVGGYYRSDDGGLTYAIHNAGLRDYFIEALAVSPADPHVILLGAEGGVYKSTDEGRTWRWMRRGFPPPERYSFSAPIGALTFDPNTPNVLYAGLGRPRWGRDGHGAIYRSTDGGETWSLCTPPGALPGDAIVSDLEVSRVGRATSPASAFVLAATQYGIFRSDDGGQTWSKSSAGLPHDNVLELAISPSQPNIVYATLRTTARDGQPWNGGVVRSDDGGRTWQLRAEGLARLVGAASAATQMTSCCKEIVVDPTSPETVYVGDEAWVSAGVYRTTDGGRHWESCGYRRPGEGAFADYGWISQWGPSVECLTISPLNPKRLYFGTSGHIFETSDAGKTWRQRYCRVLPDGRFTGAGLEVTCLFNAVPDPHQAGRLYFCYFDIGLLITEDTGATFHRSGRGMKHDGNCFTVVPDPDDENLLWAATGQWGSNQGDVCRSRDRGQTWAVVGKPETGLPDGQTKVLLLDPKSPRGRRRLTVTCGGHGLYRSENGGDSWECLNGNLPAEAAKAIRGMVIDPADANYIRVALGGSPRKQSGLYETTDGGVTWRKTNRNVEFADLQDFEADPKDFSTLYVCQRELYDRDQNPPLMRPGGLFKSTDGGATWTHLFAYHFASCVTVSPLDSRVLYLGTTDHPYHDDSIAAGVLKSKDGGQTWYSENAGLSSLQISSLSVSPRDDGAAQVIIGTGGNGAFIGIDRSPK